MAIGAGGIAVAARYFLIQARANRLMNHRLYEAVSGLSVEELLAPRQGRFPSVDDALRSLLDLTVFYACALHDQRFDLLDVRPIRDVTAAELARSQKLADEDVMRFCKGLADDDLGTTFWDIIKQRDDPTERVDRTLLHLFTSQGHLRGEILAMLAATSATLPDLHVFLMAGDSKSRVADLAACGLTEADLAP